MKKEETVTITINSQEELDKVARQLLEFANGRTCFLLYGEIGAGKTTLVKNICGLLGVKEPATSPTFSLVNEYQGTKERIYHIDLYRLKSIEEAIDIGIEDYLYGGALCFIEWPELIENIVPADAVKIYIQLSGLSGRKFLFL